MFKAHLRDVLGFDVGPEFDVTFECLMPATGSLVTLSGLNAYGAATHCAALLAAGKSSPSTPTAAAAAAAAAAAGASGPSSADATTAPAPLPAPAPRATSPAAPLSPVAMPSTPQQPAPEPARRLAAPLSSRRMCHSGYVPTTPVAAAQPLRPALPTPAHQPTAAAGFSSGTTRPATTSSAAAGGPTAASAYPLARQAQPHTRLLTAPQPCPAAAADRPRLGRVASDCALTSSRGTSSSGSGTLDTTPACGRVTATAHSRRGAWDVSQRSLHASGGSGADDEEEDEILSELQARRLGGLGRSPGTSCLSPASALPVSAVDALEASVATAAVKAVAAASLAPLHCGTATPWRRASIDVASGPGSPSNSPHASLQAPQLVRAVGYTAAAPVCTAPLGCGNTAMSPFANAAGLPFRAHPASGTGSPAKCMLPASPIAVSRAASSVRRSSIESSLAGGAATFSSGSLPAAPCSGVSVMSGQERPPLASARSGRVSGNAGTEAGSAVSPVRPAAAAAVPQVPVGGVRGNAGPRATGAASPARVRLPDVIKITARRTVDCLLRVLRHGGAQAQQQH